MDYGTFKRITGMEAPTQPITAKQYLAAGLPWYACTEEPAGISTSPVLEQVQSKLKMQKKMKKKKKLPEQRKSVKVVTTSAFA
jgi:hypothetical protein